MRNHKHGDRREHTLYRFFDIDGALLYIGVTADVRVRFRNHRQTKSWCGDVSRITLRFYPDRVSALEVERLAIISENPKYNVRYTERDGNLVRWDGIQRSLAWVNLGKPRRF